MSVGEQLTAARLRAGLSVDDVSAATRIRSGLLTAMEADDFSRCGGAFYARGHLRSIARVLDADPDPLIAEFDAGQAAVEVTPSRQEQAEAKPPTVHPARPRWTVVVGAVLVCLMGWGMVRLFTLPNDVEATAAPSTPTPSVTSPAGTTPVPPPRRTVRPAPPRAVRVTIEAVGDGSYLTLRNMAGLRLFNGMLRAGSAHSLTYGGAVRVIIGVPGNTRVFVNGARVYPKAKRFTVNLTGVVQKSEW